MSINDPSNQTIFYFFPKSLQSLTVEKILNIVLHTTETKFPNFEIKVFLKSQLQLALNLNH